MTLNASANEVSRTLNQPRLFIDGDWCDGGGTEIEVLNPFTERVITRAAGADSTQANRAVEAARRAFDAGDWSSMSARQRSAALHEICDRMVAHREAFAELMATEGGMPITLARAMQTLTEEHFRWYCDAADRGPLGGWERGMPVQRGPIPAGTIVVQEPIGVVVAITPYNIPVMGAVWKICGALAAGCTTVLMPSPRAQQTSQLFAQLVADVDLPPGVFNFIGGDAPIGQALTEHHAVDMVTFTGSEAVGARVMAQSARTIKRVVLELGGKSPNIVLPGTDIESVVPPSVVRFCRNSGQACGATTRTFVPAADLDAYVRLASSCISSLRSGDPLDESTVIGPLIRSEHRDRVEGYVERAVAAGAKIMAGGGRPDLQHGYFMNPVLIGNVSNDAEIAQEELFGPVGVIIPYDDVDDMIRQANDTRYGLNANIWGPTSDAIGVARRIRTGGVTVNGGSPQRADVPFGGVKRSGIGREMGDEGFLEFFASKSIQFPLR